MDDGDIGVLLLLRFSFCAFFDTPVILEYIKRIRHNYIIIPAYDHLIVVIRRDMFNPLLNKWQHERIQQRYLVFEQFLHNPARIYAKPLLQY